MAKRGPQSELTDRNWDDEDEPEEAGVFMQASKETLQQRVIKKAKRRGEEGSTGGKTGAFGGFGGLLQRPSLAQSNTDKAPSIKAPSANDSVFKPNFTGGATSSVDNIETSKGESKENSSYLHGLKSLNESVLAWIKQHVDKNPYIILTPIFKDYEKYLATLETKKANGANSPFSASTTTTAKQGGASEMKTTFTSPVSPKKLLDDTDPKKDGKEEVKESSKSSGFSFGSVTSNGEGFKFASATTDSGFSFGKSTTASSGFSFAQSSSTPAQTATTTAASSGFTFGSSGSTSTSTGSVFGGNSGFSFGTLAAKTMASQVSEGASGSAADDDEYVPPKPEVKEIKEEGSLYSKRCKLFYQKEGQWKERGVGNIHLKPLGESKTQILLRADTNLGNILLNIMLTSGLPVSRQGKNNILLVCVPNPPLKEGQEEDQTPIPMLIRVKTGEEADEMLAKLDERKALL